MKKLLIPAALALFAAACAAEAPPTVDAASGTETEIASMQVTHVDANGAAVLISENADIIVLDVRTPKEFAEGHIEGAININFYDDDFADQLAKLDTSETYLLHCRSGGRSSKSLPILERLGYANVTHLDGGFKAWKNAGQSVVQ